MLSWLGTAVLYSREYKLHKSRDFLHVCFPQYPLASCTMPGTLQNLNVDSEHEQVMGETRHFCKRNKSV